MFLQETKTKRGGKTYVSYLVRESFRTADGPRGRTICNLTHLPKEVRDLVGRALKGESMVPLGRIEVNGVHSCGGCVVLEDAARRYGLAELLAPLSPRNGALVQAMIFGGLLFPPAAASFYAETKPAALATFCGLDPEKERFGPKDLAAALRDLDETWPEVCALLAQPQGAVSAIALCKTAQPAGKSGIVALGLNAGGIPVRLGAVNERTDVGGAPGFLRQSAQQPDDNPPLLLLDEELAARMKLGEGQDRAYLVELSPESIESLRENKVKLHDALRKGGAVEARFHGERNILAPMGMGPEPEAPVRVASLMELTELTPAAAVEEVAGIPPRSEPIGAAPASIRAIRTNVSADLLSADAAVEWASRARMARAAFSPVRLVFDRPPSGESEIAWRNHRNLQFLMHWMRCHLHREWSGRGEARPVEEVLASLQEVYRVTLMVDGAVARQLASQPPEPVSALLAKLDLRRLFEPDEVRKSPVPSHGTATMGGGVIEAPGPPRVREPA